MFDLLTVEIGHQGIDGSSLVAESGATSGGTNMVDTTNDDPLGDLFDDPLLEATSGGAPAADCELARFDPGLLTVRAKDADQGDEAHWRCSSSVGSS